MGIITLLFILLIGSAALKTLGLVEFNPAKRRDMFFSLSPDMSRGMPIECASSATTVELTRPVEADYDLPTFMRRGVPLPDLASVSSKPTLKSVAPKRKRTRKSKVPKADVATVDSASAVVGFGGFEVVA